MELTKNFTELNATEMNEIEGGFVVTLTYLVTGLGLAAAGVTAGAAYKKYAVPKLESLGGKIYDWTH